MQLQNTKSLIENMTVCGSFFKVGKTAMFKCEHITDDALTDRVYCIHATVPTVRLMDAIRFNCTRKVSDMTEVCKVCNCSNGGAGITDSEIN